MTAGRTLAFVVIIGVLAAWPALSRSPLAPTGAAGPSESSLHPSVRRPVALAFADQERLLFVANHRSGTISVIDTASLKVVNEVKAGRKLSDLAITADGEHVLVVDEEAGELVVFRRRGLGLEEPRRVDVGHSPVSVRISADGGRCTIALLWPHRLAVVALGRPMPDRSISPRVKHVVDLAFAPRLQLLVPDSRKVIVADSFGGRLAVVDIDRGAVESDRLLPAHNIRGLALSSDGTRLLVSHQTLSSQGQTRQDDIHWGNLITNVVRELRLTAVLDPKADIMRDSRTHLLGDVGRGAGDPAGVAVVPGGKIMVALAGVDEVAVGGAKGSAWQRIAVGRRPTVVAVRANGSQAYVLNTLDDSVSVLDLKAGKVSAELKLGQMHETNAADRGERLFYDARLSHESWFSCHSCHTDGHSNGLLADTISDSTYGTPKRILSLRGVKDTGPWMWNGIMRELEGQVRKSIETTMQGHKLAAEQEEDLAAFLRTLPPAPPRDRVRGKLDAAIIARGRSVFERQGCGNCHVAPTYTSPRTYDIYNAKNKAFNPPSLRGVSQGGPYFHDGRAATLAEAFTKYRHQLRTELTKENLAELLAFLHSL